MSRLTELGYVGIGVANPDAWKTYATAIIGLELVNEGESDRFYLRADEWHHRFIVHASDQDDYLYTGWRVAGREELEHIARRLDENGIAYHACGRAEAAERKVIGLLKLKDPNGNGFEIFYGPQVDAHKPFHPGRPMFGRFATQTAGLGHCIIRQDDIPAAIAFFKVLGFTGDIEYRMDIPRVGKLDAIFLRLNQRQHSLGFAPGMTSKRFHHIMLEYSDLRDLGQAQDIAVQHGIGIPMPLGMHANDEMLSFYIQNPSGWMFELGWGGRTALGQHEYYTQDVWGHVSRDFVLGE